MERAVLIDIDNTLVNANVVFDKVRDKPREEQFQYFYTHMDDCKPMEWAIKLVKQLATMYSLVFLTGRSAECREGTIKQLKKLGFSKFTLAMRPEGDNDTPDDDIKRQLLKVLTEVFDFKLAIDDREQNCKVFREEFNIPSLVVYYPENERY